MDVNDRLTRLEDALIDLAVVVRGGHLTTLPQQTCPRLWSKRAGRFKRSTGR
jgi:hypothetical protein